MAGSNGSSREGAARGLRSAGSERKIFDASLKPAVSAWNNEEIELKPQIPEIKDDGGAVGRSTTVSPSLSEDTGPLSSETYFAGDATSATGIAAAAAAASPRSVLSSREYHQRQQHNKSGGITTLSGGTTGSSPISKTEASKGGNNGCLSSEVTSLRSLTPHSQDFRSQRDRIKERVAAAKERAMASAQAKLKPNRLRSPVDISSTESKSTKKEDDEVEEAMRRHRALRTRWKAATTTLHVASVASGHDFFSNSWEENSSDLKTTAREEGENDQMFCADVLGSKEGDWLPLFTYESPKLTNLFTKEKQAGLFFYPSDSPVPIEEKLDSDSVPRFLEDEGLYVGRKEKVHFRRQNKVEQRILAMGSEKIWFEDDGEIKGVKDPLDYRMFRDYFEDTYDPEATVFKPAVVVESEMIGVGGGYLDGFINVDDEGGWHTLEVDVGSVTFKYHPLYSREDELGSRLASLVKGHAASSSLALRLFGRLTALRNLTAPARNKEQTKKEIREVRKQWLNENGKERELMQQILNTWKDIKVLREKQGFTSTPYKLIICARETPNDDAEWQQQIDYFIAELEEEEEEKYRNQMKEYRQCLKEWEETREKRGEVDVSDERTSATEDEEPVKPRRIARSRIREKVIAEIEKMLRPPGEPIVEVELKEDGDVSTTVSDSREQQRRTAIGKTQIWIGLRHNSTEVDRVKTLRDAMFVYKASFRFCLHLSKWPKSLCLRILETGQPALFGKKPVADIYVPVPGRIDTESSEWQDYEFTCKEITGALENSAGLGTLPEKLCTGVVSVRTGWAYPLPNINQPSARSLLEQKYHKKDARSLKEWVDKVQLDPNDPSNADLLEYVKNYEERFTKNKDKSSTADGTARELSPLDFCTEEELMKNPRLKLLSLRHSGQPEFASIRRVPLNEREIPKDVFKLYEKRTGVGHAKKKSKGYLFDAGRAAGREFLEKLRDNVVKIFNQKHIKHFHEMIHEEPVPDLGTLGLTIMKWLQPKRPLRPKRKGQSKLTAKSFRGEKLEIIVNIGRAFEVPVRKDDLQQQGPFALVPVRPFIEVTFQDQRRRTTTAEGPNPTWNQDLHIPVKCPAGVHSVKDSLFIHLYDEILVDLVEDDRLRETTIQQRAERYWLGCLRIPFNALYSRIEGTFQLYAPPVLLGYRRESKDFRDSTFLTIYVAVVPPLSPPTPPQEKLESKEEPTIEIHLEQWSNQIEKMFPNRRIPSLVLDSSGKTVSVTRFFRPLPPPDLSPGETTTPEMVARFVSLIPIVPSSTHCPGHMDIWLTADEILQNSVSEPVSRAVLLVCFLKHFYPRSYLLLGSGVPDGQSAFALSFDSNSRPTLWDPSTAKMYNPTDPFSPLSTLHCVVDDTNIWVNVQKVDSTWELNLDVKKRPNSDWWPAFSQRRGLKAPLESLQPETPVYFDTPQAEVSILQDRLEKPLRSAIMKMRPTNRTVWNRYCSAALRKLLPSLERDVWNGSASPVSPTNYIKELEHIASSYKMCGFPMNQPYQNASELVEAVKSTGVHLNHAPELEFAVAVHVHSFCCNILSVWVYVASLIRRR